MNDIATLTGKPRRITVDGEAIDLYPLSFDEFGQLQAWIDRQFPDPFDVVNAQIAKGEYNVTQQQFLYRIALEQSTRGRHLLGTPEADEKARSMPGVKYLLVLSIRKGNPAFSDADADRIFGKMTLGDIARVYEATNLDMVLADPKAPTPTGAETKTATARGPEDVSIGGTSSTSGAPSSSARPGNSGRSRSRS